ncbi:MAG: DUF1573 domain-containing protein, partial [Planctomycetota bacterium]
MVPHLLRVGAVLLTLLVPFSAFAGPDGDPAFETLDPIIDFGEVQHGVVVEKTFRFKNTGTSELRLLRVDTSCGCTAALPSKVEFAPGEAGELKVSFTTREKRLTSDADVLTNTIELTTNDPRQLEGGRGKALLRLVGTVHRIHRFVPAEGPRLTARKGEAKPKAVRARIYPKNGDFKILQGARVSQVPFGLRVVDQKIIAKDGRPVGLEVAVVVTPDADTGFLSESITLEPGDPQYAPVYLPIRGDVEPSVAPSPKKLTLNGDDAESAAWIALNTQNPESLRVLEAVAVPAGGEGETPHLEVEIEPSPSGAVAPRLRVTRKKGVESGQGEIVCRLTDRHSPLVRIPYEIVSPALDQRRYELELAAKVKLNTDRVDLGKVKPQKTWHGLFTVTAAGEPVKVTDLEVVGSPLVAASADTVREGQVERVSIEVDAGAEGAIDATIRFRPRP